MDVKLLCCTVGSLTATSALSAQAGVQGVPVRVVVDPRIELMSVIQLLSGYSLVTDHDFAYKREVQTYFGGYAEHSAVQLFSEMSERFFNFDRAPKAMLSLSQPPTLKPRLAVSGMILMVAGGEEQFERFTEALHEFAVETEFMRFFDANRRTYDLLIEQAKDAVGPAVGADYLLGVWRTELGVEQVKMYRMLKD